VVCAPSAAAKLSVEVLQTGPAQFARPRSTNGINTAVAPIRCRVLPPAQERGSDAWFEALAAQSLDRAEVLDVRREQREVMVEGSSGDKRIRHLQSGGGNQRGRRELNLKNKTFHPARQRG